MTVYSQSFPVKLVLNDGRNSTYTGDIHVSPANLTLGAGPEEVEEYDYKGAGLFSVLVISVYAFSIVLFIASFIKKKQAMLDAMDEKNDVEGYLTQVAVLKEKTARENFKKLKRSIRAKIVETDPGYAGSSSDEEKPSVKWKKGKKGAPRATSNVGQVILGAGIGLYQTLLPHSKVGEERQGSGKKRSGSDKERGGSVKSSKGGSLKSRSGSGRENEGSDSGAKVRKISDVSGKEGISSVVESGKEPLLPVTPETDRRQQQQKQQPDVPQHAKGPFGDFQQTEKRFIPQRKGAYYSRPRARLKAEDLEKRAQWTYTSEDERESSPEFRQQRHSSPVPVIYTSGPSPETHRKSQNGSRKPRYTHPDSFTQTLDVPRRDSAHEQPGVHLYQPDKSESQTKNGHLPSQEGRSSPRDGSVSPRQPPASPRRLKKNRDGSPDFDSMFEFKPKKPTKRKTPPSPVVIPSDPWMVNGGGSHSVTPSPQTPSPKPGTQFNPALVKHLSLIREDSREKEEQTRDMQQPREKHKGRPRSGGDHTDFHSGPSQYDQHVEPHLGHYTLPADIMRQRTPSPVRQPPVPAPGPPQTPPHTPPQDFADIWVQHPGNSPGPIQSYHPPQVHVPPHHQPAAVPLVETRVVYPPDSRYWYQSGSRDNNMSSV